ncbi:MAG: glycosyltransferase family 9 protein [Betaproteobacteria bacterium]
MSGCWKEARTLLCVRLDGVGHVLLATPAIRAFRDSIDGCRIALLALPPGAAAGRLVPEVDEVLEYSSDETGVVSSLAERYFDAAVIFTLPGQSPVAAARLCARAGIRLRLAHCRDDAHGLLTDWLPEPDSRMRHEVRRQLDLAASVGCRTTDVRLSFAVPPGVRRRMRRSLAPLGSPLVVVHPGTSAGIRRYPPQSLALAVDLLAEQTGCEALFVGAPEDAGLLHAARDAMRQPSRELSGLSLAEFGAVVAEADLLVSNESGPAHIAAALGTPVVDVHALANPQYAPWQVPSRVLYDVYDEQRRVAPEKVAEAARTLLELGA